MGYNGKCSQQFSTLHPRFVVALRERAGQAKSGAIAKYLGTNLIGAEWTVPTGI